MSNPHVNQTSCRVTWCSNWPSPRIGPVAEQGGQVAPDYAASRGVAPTAKGAPKVAKALRSGPR